MERQTLRDGDGEEMKGSGLEVQGGRAYSAADSNDLTSSPTIGQQDWLGGGGGRIINIYIIEVHRLSVNIILLIKKKSQAFL